MSATTITATSEPTLSIEMLYNEIMLLRHQVAKHDLEIGELRLRATEKPGILSIVGAMADYPEFADVIAYGRYYRVTGQDPPDDWKPGDPIPEPSEEWCSR